MKKSVSDNEEHELTKMDVVIDNQNMTLYFDSNDKVKKMDIAADNEEMTLYFNDSEVYTLGDYGAKEIVATFTQELILSADTAISTMAATMSQFKADFMPSTASTSRYTFRLQSIVAGAIYGTILGVSINIIFPGLGLIAGSAIGGGLSSIVSETTNTYLSNPRGTAYFDTQHYTNRATSYLQGFFYSYVVNTKRTSSGYSWYWLENPSLGTMLYLAKIQAQRYYWAYGTGR